MEFRYFDHNSTTPLSDAAREAWLGAAQTQWLNPSSPYRAAAAVKARYEAARESLAAHFQVPIERIVFTSGATEANNAVMRAWASRLGTGKKIGINPTEHPSVLECAKTLLGERVEWLPVQSDGVIDFEALKRLVLSGELAAVSVMAANNETGVLQPWQAIAALCHQAGVPYHCDASQWVGRMPVEGLSACDYLTACAHKFGGLKGVGFMLLPAADSAFDILLGGAHEMGHRAGTENVAGVLAMLAALEASQVGEVEARDVFIRHIRAQMEGVEVVGEAAPRLWNTVALLMPKYSSARWVRALEKAGFLVGAGAACSMGRSTVSPVLSSMGIEAEKAERVVRISSSANTSLADWEALADALPEAYRMLEQSSADASSTVISID